MARRRAGRLPSAHLPAGRGHPAPRSRGPASTQAAFRGGAHRGRLGGRAGHTSPPVSADAPDRLDDLLRSERTELRDAASAYEVSHVTGFSTHLNVSVPDDRALGIAHAFMNTCLVALATVIEPAGSKGLLVRPRRGRLEIRGEYLEGPDLIAGLTLLAGCGRGLREGSAPKAKHVPEATATRERFGWFVPPGAEHDLEVLRSVWSWARSWAQRDGLDPGPVDELAQGVRPPRHQTADIVTRCTFGAAKGPPTRTVSGPRTLPDGIHAETEWLTWDHVVWLFRDRPDISAGPWCRPRGRATSSTTSTRETST